MLRTLARVGLALWGVFLIAYAVAELLDPGLLQSEPRHPSRRMVLPGALSIAAIGIYLLLPARVLSNRGWRRFGGGLVCACVAGLPFLAPGAIGKPLHLQSIVFVALFYAVPCIARFLLQPGGQAVGPRDERVDTARSS